MQKVRIIGGGLAGSEASWQLLKRGYKVELIEMRPSKTTPAHKTSGLAELVCSNSLKSMNNDSASGQLKAEMKEFDSLVLAAAEKAKVPAGAALSVNREIFSSEVEKALSAFDGFTRVNAEYTEIDETAPTIIATGPLTSDALMSSIARLTGQDGLYFYDAAAPIVSADSIDETKCFFAARYNKGDADYLNCPMNKEEYDAFYDALYGGKTVELEDYENNVYEGCMPIEVMAKRGKETMLYGPLRPVGIYDENNIRPFAVVQLRKENTESTMYNLVGFQTNLLFGEQQRIFRMIPALSNAEFLRYGVMHRNSYIHSPKFLDEYFAVIGRENICFAGQITGVEGYMESAASGMLAAIHLARRLRNMPTYSLPKETILGGLSAHISSCIGDFQPMNANFGILTPITERIRDKKLKKQAYVERGIAAIREFILEKNYNE